MTYKVEKFPQGTFSWADMQSTNAAAAKEFYSALMGWSHHELPVGEGQFYTMFQVDGEDVAGLGQHSPEMMEQGIPSHWNSYITVDDVDAIAAKVSDLGGTVIMEPFDVLESGRMAVISDPTGAVVNLWEARDSIGAGIVNTTGAMMWNELMTTDAEAAKTFYGALLGWKFDTHESGYNFILNNGRMNGGVMQITPEMGEMPSHWMVYYTVTDIDASTTKAGELGGTIVMGPMDAMGTGRFTIVQDPAGAVFTIMQSNQEPQHWDD